MSPVVNITRRLVSAGLTSLVLTGRLLAQPANARKRIGFLIGNGTEEQGHWRIDAFGRGLAKLGWSDGRNVQQDYRWPNGDPVVARQMAGELIAARPDVLVATNTLSLNALRAATQALPIIFVNVSDPVTAGFVDSLSRPGGNITGFTDMGSGIAPKWLELLKRLVPSLRSVAVIYNPETSPWMTPFLPAFEQGARDLSLTVRFERVAAREDYLAKLAGCRKEDGCAVMLNDDGLFNRNLDYVAGLAKDLRLAALYSNGGYVVTYGGLIAYGVFLADLYEQAMSYVDRVLRGDKPATLPVQAPARYRLAVNLKTAAAVGIDVPQDILLEADRVIE